MSKIEISPKSVIIAIAIFVAYQFIVQAQYIFALILIAYIIMSAIDPLVQLLERKKVNRTLSILGIYTFFAVIAVTIAIFVITPLINEAIELYKQLPILLDKAIKQNPVISQYIPADFASNIKETTKNAGNILGTGNIQTVYKTAIGAVKAFAALLSLIVMSIYMLMDKEENYKGLANIIYPKNPGKAIMIFKKFEAKLGEWVQAQLILSFFIFVAYYITMFILKIKFGLTISLLAGFLEVIPVAGPVITAVIALTITLLINPANILYVLIAAIVIQQTEAHVLVPKIMQKVVGLSPLITIVALLIGSEFFGIIGAILSVPIAAILQILYLEYKKYDKS